MRFIDRLAELERLDRLVARPGGGFAVVYGRRRIGKTRLLVEWVTKHGGLYTVADQSAAEIQRRYFAQSVAEHVSAFADVVYPDWPALLARLAREAKGRGWRGPIVFDELPYLVMTTPELPSQLQRWIDHEAKAAGLVVAVAGSSQRLMQGIVLDAGAPIFGRAHEILRLESIPPRYLPEAFVEQTTPALVECWAAWGGIPRYWELAVEVEGTVADRIDRLVLNPLGPLHREPDRLLIEEIPPALELRPILDAIGGGAHRISEIAGRIGRPVTSLSRPMSRLVELGLVAREIPFGEDEERSRRSLYRIGDPFFRMWFAAVASHRGKLALASERERLGVLAARWPHLVAQAWEDLCRGCLPRVASAPLDSETGTWACASRWWHGDAPEWDVVAESVDQRRLLLGEAKWTESAVDRRAVERAARQLLKREPPPLPQRYQGRDRTRALFFPRVEPDVPRIVQGVAVITAADLLA